LKSSDWAQVTVTLGLPNVVGRYLSKNVGGAVLKLEDDMIEK
jgi:hypothetical protein